MLVHYECAKTVRTLQLQPFDYKSLEPIQETGQNLNPAVIESINIALMTQFVLTILN